MSNQTIDDLLKDRGERYNLNGSYYDHAKLTQEMKELMRNHPGWETLQPDMMESLDMIVHKIARVINGCPTYKDNWMDIMGYSKLVADSLKD